VTSQSSWNYKLIDDAFESQLRSASAREKDNRCGTEQQVWLLRGKLPNSTTVDGACVSSRKSVQQQYMQLIVLL